jgi:uncharacterized damage-inducible protein DinB
MPSMPTTLTAPTVEEYAPFYADYIQRAEARRDVFSTLHKQIDELNEALGKLTDEQSHFRPAPAEWSIKEVIGHLNDVERIFSYRLLRVSRNDKTSLPGFEQDDFVREAGFDNHDFKDLLTEFELLRAANVIAISNMSEEAAQRIGTASNNPVSARALIYMLVGHVEHHMASLREKYLPGLK